MDGLKHVGEDRTDHKVDLITLDHAAHLGHGHIGLEFVIHHDDFGVDATEFAAELADRELEAIARLLSENGRRPRQGDHDADLEFFLRLRCTDRGRQNAGRGQPFPLQNHRPTPCETVVCLPARTCGLTRTGPYPEGILSLKQFGCEALT